MQTPETRATALVSRARFAAEALLTFAAQVRRYCESYPGRVRDLHGSERDLAVAGFFRNAATLVRMLSRLRSMAEASRALRVLYFDQLEAEEAAARESLARMADLEARRRGQGG